jgi:hypothetical protein
MPHPLVEQLRFARHEWLRGLEKVSDEDAARHFGPMNCISWTVGHLAWHEQRYWLELVQGQMVYPLLNQTYGFGSPMSSPALSETLEIWRTVTAATDPFLDTLTSDSLLNQHLRKDRPHTPTLGSALLRMIYHYWYHIGEIQATRQILEHKDLPGYVGDIDMLAPYRPG